MQIVQNSLSMLEEKQENWVNRWIGYAENISRARKSIEVRRKFFNEWSPLKVYMPVGEMKTTKYSEFSVRFHGADVAHIRVSGCKEPRLILKEWTKKKEEKHHHSFNNRKKYGLNIPPGDYQWSGSEARELRAHFKFYDEDFEDSSEHTLESLILDELESRDKAEKFQGTLHNIRPVKLADKIRFQMAVPLKGNDGKPTCPAKSRGNTDILARIKVGGVTSLGVLELKKDDRSAYKAAVKQGLIYSASIHALLKCERSGHLWWDIFGYKKEKPESKTIYSIALLPESLKSQYVQELNELSIDNENNEIKLGKDVIKVGFIFFQQTGKKISITDYSWKEGDWRAYPTTESNRVS